MGCPGLTRIACSIDLGVRGRHIGHLGVPFSNDAHGWVHGDEYEGQVVLRRLIRTLDPGRLSGRSIVLPALNLPAVRAARRTSQVDGEI